MTIPHEAARQAVVDACQTMAREQMVVGTAGNVSIRVGEEVVISPSGVDYSELSAADVGIHRLDGSPVHAPLRPSSELPLHLAIYQASEHTAIVHTHSVASTSMSTIADEVATTHYYSALFGGAVRVAPYATFGSDQLATNVVTALKDRTAALMGNHGAVLVGSDLSKVLNQVPYLEYICEVQLRALASGLTPRALSSQEIERVAEGLSSYGQSATSARG